jgi:hypothetical protein
MRIVLKLRWSPGMDLEKSFIWSKTYEWGHLVRKFIQFRIFYKTNVWSGPMNSIAEATSSAARVPTEEIVEILGSYVLTTILDFRFMWY